MGKVTRIPRKVGIDGYSLPEQFRPRDKPQHKEAAEGFGELLDYELGRRRHETVKLHRSDPVRRRREP